MKMWWLTGVALLVALTGSARSDEASAVAALKKLKAEVTLDDKMPGKPVVAIDLTNSPVTDADLKNLKQLPHLKSIDLANTRVTAKGLKELNGLKQLTTVGLYGTLTSDADLKELKDLQQLTRLNLTLTRVTDA